MNQDTLGHQLDGLAEEANPRRPSIVIETAEALRRDALQSQDGELLGGEDDLVRRYGVSRPTLRLAAALVTQEKLLRVKRGLGGGYFASRPDSRAVAHMAAIYLRTQETRVDEVIRAIEPIRVELSKLAAASKDEAAREEMRRFVAEKQEETTEKQLISDFLRRELEFAHILGKMAGNKVISLFLLILYDFSSIIGLNDNVYVSRPQRMEEYRQLRTYLAEAIIRGDVEMAGVTAQRCARMSARWVLEELGVQSEDSAFSHLVSAAR